MHITLWVSYSAALGNVILLILFFLTFIVFFIIYEPLMSKFNVSILNNNILIDTSFEQIGECYIVALSFSL